MMIRSKPYISLMGISRPLRPTIDATGSRLLSELDHGRPFVNHGVDDWEIRVVGGVSCAALGLDPVSFLLVSHRR